MAIEALRTQLDAVLWEKRELDAENRRLREDNPGAARVVELEEELAQSKAELAQSKAALIDELEEELAQSKAELAQSKAALIDVEAERDHYRD